MGVTAGMELIDGGRIRDPFHHFFTPQAPGVELMHFAE